MSSYGHYMKPDSLKGTPATTADSVENKVFTKDKYCTKCGRKRRALDNFCGECGEKFE